MDSLTQLALGAAVGQAVLGRKAEVTYRAPLWGAICGTLPDLDVFINFGGAVENFTYHRGFSHSLLVLTLLAPAVVWLILKIHPQTASLRRHWLLLIWLALVTHPLLDCFTVYGTQILWPFGGSPPVSWSTIFIIDPGVTVPLLAGLICALSMRRRRALGQGLNYLGLGLAVSYLSWSVFAKWQVEATVRPALARQGIDVVDKNLPLLTTPAPFNTILWRIVVIADDGYYEGYYSLLDDGAAGLKPRFYPSESTLLAGLTEHWPVQRLRWFTHGFYAVGRSDLNGAEAAVTITDLRMGVEPNYVFGFTVAKDTGSEIVPVVAERRETLRSLDGLSWLWNRMWGISSGTGWRYLR